LFFRARFLYVARSREKHCAVFVAGPAGCPCWGTAVAGPLFTTFAFRRLR
jgi:hypothetical protein